MISLVDSLRVQRTRRALACAHSFEQPLRFAASALLHFDEQPRTWTLLNGSNVVLRSGTSDIDIFEEIYVRCIYDPPPPVRAALCREPVRLIADLGANVGIFALRMLGAFQEARVVSFEPDPDNLAVLRACRSGACQTARWDVHGVAAGTAKGEMDFLTGRRATSRRPMDDELGDPALGRVPVVDCLSVLAAADFVKIDIEGGEWPILADPRFCDLRARAIVLEYHPEHKPGMREAGDEARALLAGAGYRVADAGSESQGCGELWAWRA